MELPENVQGGIQDAGAVSPELSGAAPISAPASTDAGAVSPETQPSAVEGVPSADQTTDTTSQEVPEGGTEGHKKSLEERVQELADKRFAELQQRFEETQRKVVESTPDFKEINYAAYDNYIAKLYSTEQQLLEELKLEPENPADFVRELRRVRAERETLEQSFADNERRREAYEARMQQDQQMAAFFKQTQAHIDTAAQLLKTHEQISDEVFEAGRQFFIKACKENPLLQRQFDETVTNKGPTAGVLFAWDHTKREMGKKEQAIIQQKEAAKDALPTGMTTTGAVVGNPQLDALRAKAQQTGNIDDVAKYMSAKRQATQT